MTTDTFSETWSSGSYPDIAKNYLPIAGSLVERTNVTDDDTVLDVGCGTGNVAITAARRGAAVTGIDINETMLGHARENAAFVGVDDIEWERGNVTDLSVDADTCDVTLSCFGHMYGDPPEASARELLRVTKPGGRIAFTSWTPTDLYPFMAGVLSTYLDPEDVPEFTEPPFMWGDSSVVESRLGDDVESIAFDTASIAYPALSPEHFWREMATKSGTFVVFLDLVPEDDRGDLREEMVETIQPYFDDRRNAVELEYLLTTATV